MASTEHHQGQQEGSLEVDRRRALRHLNLQAAAGETLAEGNKRLDGSIKKNSAFVKKLRSQLSAESSAALRQEAAALTLEKYLSELVLALAETKLKSTADALAAAELCTDLHLRFGPAFTEPLMEELFKLIEPPPVPAASSDLSIAAPGGDQKDKEEAARLSKMKSALRQILELFLVGIVHAKYKDSTIKELLKRLLQTDKEFLNVSLAVLLAKNYGPFLLPSSAIKQEDDKDWLPHLKKEEFYNVLKKYFEFLSAKLVREIERLHAMDKANLESTIARGSLTDNRKEKQMQQAKIVEYLSNGAKSLATSLGLDMPEMPLAGTDAESSAVRMSVSFVGPSTETAAEVDDVWDNDEDKRFYTDIPDLKNLVPPACLELEKTLSDSVTGDVKEDNLAIEEEPTEEEPTSRAVQFEKIQAAVSSHLSRDNAESLAVDFALINNKNTKKRLAKLVLSLYKTRPDLLSGLARLLAILHPYMPEISSIVLYGIEDFLHRFMRPKERVPIDEKVNAVRFMGELTKIRVAPLHTSFHFLKTFLDDFSSVSVELLCVFMETCGRFLLASPNTSERMSSFMEVLLKKRTSLKLDNRLCLMIDNAYYQCKPKEEGDELHRKEKDPLDVFLSDVLYVNLNREKALLLLRKLDWNESLAKKIIAHKFYKPEKFKFSQLDIAADLISDISVYHPDFVIQVVDNLVESVRQGLENNVFKENQKRVAQVKFLAELVNSKILELAFVFDLLYLILTWGYDSTPLSPDIECPFDDKRDFFRVRLCCVMLETCGLKLQRRRLLEKLDRYLAYFQLYILCKVPPPMDIEFLILDTYELVNPKWKMAKTYTEAAELVNSFVDNKVISHAEISAQDDDESDDEDEDEEDMTEIISQTQDFQVVDDERPVNALTIEPDLDFEKEFSQLLIDGLDTRKMEKRPQAFDVSVPMRSKTTDMHSDSGGIVNFTVMMKKGSKAQTKQILVPSDNKFVVNALSKQAASFREKEELKRIVLNMEKRNAFS